METKKCAKCNRELPIENFNVRFVCKKYRPFSYCKECERNYNNRRYKHTCEKCGKSYNSGKKDSSICKECHNKIIGDIGGEALRKYMKIPENNPFYGVHRFGTDNPNYHVDKTDDEREQQRAVVGYADWRIQVYERDNYKCQCCGDDKGGNLVAHHLDGYSWCKEKRTDVDNGVTLCSKCHDLFHKQYGYFKNTREQYIEFINNMLIPR